MTKRAELAKLPRYSLHCQIVKAASEDAPEVWHIAQISQLENLTADSPDQVVSFAPLEEPSKETSEFRVSVSSTRLYVVEGALCCLASGKPLFFTARADATIDPASTFEAVLSQISDRNKKLQLETPEELRRVVPKITADTRDEIFIQLSQETDVFIRSACDGKRLVSFSRNFQAGTLTYERKELSHRVQLALTPEEVDAGLSVAFLEDLVRAQDSDAAIAHYYIMSVLAPPAPLPPREYAGGWIDFNDVIEKIGWYPQSTEDRREMHSRIWGFVRYGERAHIIGKRSIMYRDKDTGEEIDTEIHGAAWRVMRTEQPLQLSPYSVRDVPVRAEIVMSKELTALITSQATAQYLPLGRLLGAIPGGKPSGAWARVMGLSLASFWRRNPRETETGSRKPTRRELLDHYASKVAPFQEILSSKNPARGVEYWCDALQILADSGFIAREAEASINWKEMRAKLPTKGWQEAWLNETVTIKPGKQMKQAIRERAQALPALKPRDLKSKPRKKRAAASQKTQ